MLYSVDSHIAGEKYDIPTELADSYILRGYATGVTSREYTPEEAYAMSVNSQVVGT